MGKAPKDATKSQRQRFIEAAREAGADEDGELFEQQLKAVAHRNSVPGAKAAEQKTPRRRKTSG
jgi:hypothetical protein